MNEFIGLTAMNQVWMREHNRVSDFFIKLNPQWDDERLHQESRRIVIAEMQHVVYNEFVPLLLGMCPDSVGSLSSARTTKSQSIFITSLLTGEKLTKSLGLNCLTEGYYHGYDDSLDAGVANSFASAAFRFFHSMIKVSTAFQEFGKYA